MSKLLRVIGSSSQLNFIKYLLYSEVLKLISAQRNVPQNLFQHSELLPYSSLLLLLLLCLCVCVCVCVCRRNLPAYCPVHANSRFSYKISIVHFHVLGISVWHTSASQCVKSQHHTVTHISVTACHISVSHCDASEPYSVSAHGVTPRHLKVTVCQISAPYCDTTQHDDVLHLGVAVWHTLTQQHSRDISLAAPMCAFNPGAISQSRDSLITVTDSWQSA